MAEHQALKPQFFITRTTGALVPLIALDELPANIRIRGVPRNLSTYEIGGMTGLGTAESRHQYYVVEGVNNSQPDMVAAGRTLQDPMRLPIPAPTLAATRANLPFTVSYRGPCFPLYSRPFGKMANCTQHSTDSSVTGESKVSDASNGPGHAATPATTASQGSPASSNDMMTRNTTLPVGGKEYCSYWIRRGECDYAQQGCLYKHEMPLDLPTLERIGVRDIPRWYREKYGLGSLLVAGGTSGLSYGVSDAKASSRVGGGGQGANRMNHTTTTASGFRPGGWRNGGRSRRPPVRDEKSALAARETDEKDLQDHLRALELDEKNEKERQAMAAKYPQLHPHSRSIFEVDLASEGFSDGEDRDSVMVRIAAKEQEGWEEEQARAQMEATAQAQALALALAQATHEDPKAPGVPVAGKTNAAEGGSKRDRPKPYRPSRRHGAGRGGRP